MQVGISRHVDHIVPARLILRLRVGNPDRRENLQCICGSCHGYKLQADHKLCLGDRLSYLEVRSQNELTGFGFAKDYDAVVTVRTEAGEQRFALEYERSPKTIKYYRGVAASLSREHQVNQVLYLVSNYDLLQFISGFFRNAHCRVFLGLAKDWHNQLLDMPVSCNSATRCFRFRETLNDPATHVEGAVNSA
jgi:HNH endonuclease